MRSEDKRTMEIRWGEGSEVTLHWKGPEKDPTCCLRPIGTSRSRKSQ
jgi:hypothetical protein